MKKIMMEKTQIPLTNSLKLCSLLYWISILLALAESLDNGILVFPPPDSEWRGKVELVRNILVDDEKQRVYFASTNRLFSVSSDLKSTVRTIEWNPSNTTKLSCQKRENEARCENFITILEFDFNNDLYVCGTNALKPGCLTLDRNTFTKPDKVIDGYRQYSPRTGDGTVVALFLEPYLFIGMRANEEQGKLFKLRPYQKDILATTKESKIFVDFHPDFVSAYSYDNYSYIFLRENGYESGKRHVRYSRLARLCKHDNGVPRFRLNNFITLLKTRIQCNQKTGGPTDLFYDHLQNTFELVLKNPSLTKNENTYIYGVFSIAKGLALGSAICRYRLKDIQHVFSSSFLYRKQQNGQMSKVPFSPLRTKITRTECNSKTIDINMKELSELGGIGPQLLYDDVIPFDSKALFSTPGVSFTALVADEVKSSDGSSNVVIFAGTTDGRIYKILVGKDGQGKVLGEPFYPFQNSKSINSLKKMGDVLYAGGFDGIASFRVDRCDVYTDTQCEHCIRDPYCRWTDDKCIDDVDGQPKEIEMEIERICPKTTAATSSMTASSTTSAHVTTQLTTSTEALTRSKTKHHINTGTTASNTDTVVSTQAPTTTIKKGIGTVTEASTGGAKKSYYTEFIIMTILFVLILILLTVVLLKTIQSRQLGQDSTDGMSAETKKGCYKFCPTSFSKAYLIDRDHANGKLMKENLYKDTTVELNDVGKNGRHNVKVT